MRDECKFCDHLKKKIRDRDGNRCINCDSIENLTIAHTFKWKSKGGLAVEFNGITLCRTCHDKMDFRINCTIEEQIKILKICRMYLTLFYNREITDEEVTSKKYVLERKSKI